MSVHHGLKAGVLALLVCATSLASGAAKNNGGASAGEFLRLGSGAAAPAMGDAQTAAARGTAAIHYNPAGLAWGLEDGGEKTSEIAASYHHMVLDVGYGDLAYARPFNGRAGLGFEVRYLSYGTIDRNRISTTGGLVSSVRAGSFDAHDVAVSAAYAYRLETLSFGVVGRLISSQLDGDAAWAGAMDVGLQWKPERIPVEFGLTVANFGSSLKYDRDREELPRLVRLGASAWLWKERARIHIDGEFARKEEGHVMAGLEFLPVQMLALRAGYDGRVDGNGSDRGWTAGAGFRVRSLTLDYAYVPFGDLGDNHRVALRYRF